MKLLTRLKHLTASADPMILICFSVSLILTVFSVILSFQLIELSSDKSIPNFLSFRFGADQTCLAISSLLLLSFLQTPKDSRIPVKAFALFIFSSVYAAFNDFCMLPMVRIPQPGFFVMLCYVCSLMTLILLLLLLWMTVFSALRLQQKRAAVLKHAVSALYLLLLAACPVNLFTPLFFRISETGRTENLPFYKAIHVVYLISIVLAAAGMLLSGIRMREKILLAVLLLLPAENTVIAGFLPVMAPYSFFQIVIVLIFSIMTARNERMRIAGEKALYEARVAVMVSQMRPHFMYNALTSMAMMCTIDPKKAQEAIIIFSKYLRVNMDALKQSAPVPFSQELEHLKKYLYIEQLRFAKKLQVVYDITASDFVLPVLSIQPIAENAVKHGVGMKKQGGTVTIATRETETAYEVIVSDDGVGFDTSAPPNEDGRSHVGMENTRTRLKEMCGGELRTESTVGEGTTVTVILPKEGQPHENSVSG